MSLATVEIAQTSWQSASGVRLHDGAEPPAQPSLRFGAVALFASFLIPAFVFLITAFDVAFSALARTLKPFCAARPTSFSVFQRTQLTAPSVSRERIPSSFVFSLTIPFRDDAFAIQPPA